MTGKWSYWLFLLIASALRDVNAAAVKREELPRGRFGLGSVFGDRPIDSNNLIVVFPPKEGAFDNTGGYPLLFENLGSNSTTSTPDPCFIRKKNKKNRLFYYTRCNPNWPKHSPTWNKTLAVAYKFESLPGKPKTAYPCLVEEHKLPGGFKWAEGFKPEGKASALTNRLSIGPVNKEWKIKSTAGTFWRSCRNSDVVSLSQTKNFNKETVDIALVKWQEISTDPNIAEADENMGCHWFNVWSRAGSPW